MPTGHPAEEGLEERHLQIVQRIGIDVMGQGVRDAPAVAVEQQQIEAIHAPIVPLMEVVVSRCREPAERQTRKGTQWQGVEGSASPAEEQQRDQDAGV